MNANEYREALQVYEKASKRKKQLQTIIRMNKVWIGTGMGKKLAKRQKTIIEAEAELAILIVPPKPAPVIKGFEIYIENVFEGFIETQDITEANNQAKNFGLANYILIPTYI